LKPAYAFFDVDGTLIRGKSMFAFHDYWYQRWIVSELPTARHDHEDIQAILKSLVEHAAPRELINRRYYEFFAGRPVAAVTQCAQAWAEEAMDDPHFFIGAVCDRLQTLREQGLEPVFVSGSFVEALKPIARRLGVEHVRATRMMNDGYKYNGRIKQPQTIGPGKARAMAHFLAQQDVPAADCWAFGDDLSDVPMLEAVGHPVAVIGDPALAEVASLRGWAALMAGTYTGASTGVPAAPVRSLAAAVASGTSSTPATVSA
jgi:HAD superfamily hydrolase (TIGR01490 family)